MCSPLPLTIVVVNSMGKVENSAESDDGDGMGLQVVQEAVMVHGGDNGPLHFRENYAPDLVPELGPVKYSITQKML